MLSDIADGRRLRQISQGAVLDTNTVGEVEDIASSWTETPKELDADENGQPSKPGVIDG